MEPQLQSAYNLSLCSYLSSTQIHHLAFLNEGSLGKMHPYGSTLHWIESSPPFRAMEGKWIGIAVGAGKREVRLWAVWQGRVQLLTRSKLHEDIKGMVVWDKVIVLWTDLKIVGLSYNTEQSSNLSKEAFSSKLSAQNISSSCLVNTFLLSLEYLPSLPSQVCSNVVVDSNGHHLIAYRHPHLLIAFSQSAMKRHRTKLCSKPFCSIVTEDIKWNRVDKPAAVDQILQIRLGEMGFKKVQVIKCIEEVLYFIGEKSNPTGDGKGVNFGNIPSINTTPQISSTSTNRKLFYISLSIFYVEFDGNRPICQEIASVQKGIDQIIPIYANKEWQYLMRMGSELFLQVPKKPILPVISLSTPFKFYSSANQQFPLLLQPLGSNSIIVVSRQRNYQGTYNFKSRQISMVKGISSCIIKFNAIIYSNSIETGCTYLNPIGVTSVHPIGINSVHPIGVNPIGITQPNALNSINQNIIIGRNLGKIIDLHLGSKASIIIDNPYENVSRVFELSKSLKVDPQLRVIDQRKIDLQKIIGIQQIKSFQIYNPGYLRKIDYLVIMAQNSTSLWKQSQEKEKAFEVEMEEITGVWELELSGQRILAIAYPFQNTINTAGTAIIVRSFEKGEIVKKIQLGVSIENSKVYAVQGHLLVVLSDQIILLHVSTQLISYLPNVVKKEQILISIHVSVPPYSQNKVDLSSIELTIVYQTSLQIWQILPENIMEKERNTKKMMLLWRTSQIGEGFVFLCNELSTKSQMKDQKFNRNSNRYRSFTCSQHALTSINIQELEQITCPVIKSSHLTASHLLMLTSEPSLLLYRRSPLAGCESNTLNPTPHIAYIYQRQSIPLSVVKSSLKNANQIIQIGMGFVRVGSWSVTADAQFLEWGAKDKEFRSLFKMTDDYKNAESYKNPSAEDDKNKNFDKVLQMENCSVWALLAQNKVRQMDFRGQIYNNFVITPIDTHITTQLAAIDSTQSFYSLHSRSSFQVLDKDYKSRWNPTLISQSTLLPQTIITMKMFSRNFLAMSYYDCWRQKYTNTAATTTAGSRSLNSSIQEQGAQTNNQSIIIQQSIKFRFRIYNADSRVKILEKEKMEEPIIHIKYVEKDKLILVTSSTIFVNVLRNDKTLELIRTCTFPSKRAFLSAFTYLPQMPQNLAINQPAKPGYMLFGGSNGGISFYVGKWIEEDKLKQQWFDNVRCCIREMQFIHYGLELKTVLADDEGNVIVLNLKHDSSQKLADIHLQSQVTALKVRSQSDKTVYICLSDGGIRTIAPIKVPQKAEVDYLDFQEVFCEQLPFLGGFNLRESRQLKQKCRTYKFLKKGNIVDGEILQDYFSLTYTLRKYIEIKSEIKLANIKTCII